VQAGFAAMGRFVATAPPAENERAMLEELEGASTGEITVASRDATLDGVKIREGAYLGLVDDVAVASGPDLDAVLHEVVDRVLARGQSFLTILTGEEAPALDGLVAALEAHHPDLEVEIHEGGQPHYPLLLVAQ
jgi:dihydroxyacetone kinase-like predicted kinase